VRLSANIAATCHSSTNAPREASRSQRSRRREARAPSPAGEASPSPKVDLETSPSVDLGPSPTDAPARPPAGSLATSRDGRLARLIIRTAGSFAASRLPVTRRRLRARRYRAQARAPCPPAPRHLPPP